MTFENFKWLNETEAEYKDGVLKVYVPGHTDYFNSPVKENGTFPVTATVRYGMPTTCGSRFPEWMIALPSIIPPMA